MQCIIDRFEDDYAIVEYTDEQDAELFARIESVLLPGAKEGDVIEITINAKETEEREKRIRKLMDNLFKD